VRLAVCLVAVLCAVRAMADDAPIQTRGGVVQPMEEHPSVVMDEMLVDVRLGIEVADVDCRFTFRNTGRASTVRVGFPESGSGEWFAPGETPRGFQRFETRVDGVLVPSTIEGLRISADRHGWRRWRVKRVRFGSKQIRRLQVTYTAPVASDVLGTRFFNYAIGTGGAWKGPIGRVSVRFRAQYDPFDWDFHPDPRLRAVTSGTFEWSAKNVEPEPNDSVMASFTPAGVALQSGSLPDDQRGPAGNLYHRDLRQGHFWVSARMLQRLLGFELYAIEWPTVRLTLGGRRLYLRVGEPWMLGNGQRIPLPGAPHLEVPLPGEAARGDRVLKVPLAAVARNLGASVDYDQSKRALQVTLPIHTALSEALLEGYAAGILATLANTLSGYTPPDDFQFAPEVLRESGCEAPWLATGDYNGDGAPDVALLLHQQGAFLLVVFHGRTGAWAGVVGIRSWPAGMLDASHIGFLLRTRGPGEVAFWQEGDTTRRSGRLDLKHDGIEAIAVGKAATLHYWDDEKKAYRSVVSAD